MRMMHILGPPWTLDCRLRQNHGLNSVFQMSKIQASWLRRAIGQLTNSWSLQAVVVEMLLICFIE